MRTETSRSVLSTPICAATFVALCFAALLGIGQPVAADPFTPHLDPLIDELEARSAALEGSTDKAELKQKKTLDKLLKAFVKPSKGADRDLKTLAKAVKALVKTFPEEFAAPAALTSRASLAEESLASLIQVALDAFGGDIEALLMAAQGVVDGAPTGKCQDKAQVLLDRVTTTLDESGAADPATAAKSLTKALKDALKGQGLADKALGCLPKPPKLKWYISIASMQVDGAPKSFFDNAHEFDDDEMGSTHFKTSNSMFIFLGSMSHGIALDFSMATGPNPVGDHFIVGNYTDASGFYQVSGIVKVTRFPSLPGHVHATFDLHGTGTLGTVGEVEVTGSFSIYTYDAG